MPEGRVKRYERNAGFGFIETNEGDLFVHHTALKGREFLLPGQRVEFQIQEGERGPRAVNVRVTAEAPPKLKNHPDWRGHRGGAPRFEGQARVLPARTRRSQTGPPRGAGSARPAPSTSTERLGPPQDEGEEPADDVETQSEEAANAE